MRSKTTRMKRKKRTNRAGVEQGHGGRNNQDTGAGRAGLTCSLICASRSTKSNSAWKRCGVGSGPNLDPASSLYESFLCARLYKIVGAPNASSMRRMPEPSQPPTKCGICHLDPRVVDPPILAAQHVEQLDGKIAVSDAALAGVPVPGRAPCSPALFFPAKSPSANWWPRRRHH